MSSPNSKVLETERLILRRLTMDDLDDLFKLYHSPDVRKYYSEGIPPYEETRQELEWMINHCYVKYGFGMWATIHKETGKFIGRCGLTPMDIEGHEEIEVGYMLAKEYWGQGLATEAAQAILRYGFEQAGLSRLICVINPGNQASSRVALKIGMTLEIDGDVNGEPTLLYSINKRSEFPPLRATKWRSRGAANTRRGLLRRLRLLAMTVNILEYDCHLCHTKSSTGKNTLR